MTQKYRNYIENMLNRAILMSDNRTPSNIAETFLKALLPPPPDGYEYAEFWQRKLRYGEWGMASIGPPFKCTGELLDYIPLTELPVDGVEQVVTQPKKLSLGSIVIVHGDRDFAAIVIKATSDTVVLSLFLADPSHPIQLVTNPRYGKGNGEWSWPERAV